MTRVFVPQCEFISRREIYRLLIANHLESPAGRMPAYGRSSASIDGHRTEQSGCHDAQGVWRAAMLHSYPAQPAGYALVMALPVAGVSIVFH